MFYFAEKAFNQMTFLINMLIIIPLHFFISFWRNDNLIPIPRLCEQNYSVRKKVEERRQNFYLYSAVNPRNGKEISLLAPYVNTDCMNVFLEQMSKDLGTREVLLIMDCASWHRSKGLRVPKNITIIYLPPYSPELNPVERLWQYLKDNLIKNRIYDSVSLLEDTVCAFIRNITESSIKTICSVSYLPTYLCDLV
jgi:transposase